MFYRYSYSPAPESFVFQGTASELRQYLYNNPHMFVKNGGNGSYVICGSSYGKIHEFANETDTTPIRSCVPNKDALRTYFNKKRITEKDYRQLANELNSGKLEFRDLENV